MTVLKLHLIGVVLAGSSHQGQWETITIVEKLPETGPWEFRARTARLAHVSAHTWNEYIKYKEQSCRSERGNDSSKRAADYLNWEDMMFHKNLRMKLLPNMEDGAPMSFADALLLAKVDSRLLNPEPQSQCEFISEDSGEVDTAEKHRFEDRLISRIFMTIVDDDYYDSYSDEYYE